MTARPDNDSDDNFTRKLREELERLDSMDPNSFSSDKLQNRIDAVERRASNIASKVRALHSVVDLRIAELSEHRSLLDDVDHLIALIAASTPVDVVTVESTDAKISRILSKVSAGVSPEELIRLAEELLSLPDSSLESGAVAIFQGTLSNLQALGVIIGLENLSAFLVQCKQIDATSISLPQPPRSILLKIHDALELALKTIGPCINPAGTAVAVAMVEVCKWLRKTLLESGSNKKDVAKTLFVVEQLLDQWDISTSRAITDAVASWLAASSQAMKETLDFTRSICKTGDADAQQGAEPDPDKPGE